MLRLLMIIALVIVGKVMGDWEAKDAAEGIDDE
jgi:hypothetical protein